MRLSLLVLFFSLLFFQFCDTSSPEPEDGVGKLKFEFIHEADGQALRFDTLMYLNAAGNNYLVNEIQYFISDVYIVDMQGEKLYLNNWDDIHYVDTDIEETHIYTFNEKIPEGTYKGIGLTFGINEQKNKSLMFVNPPESFMFWPENLGGGYHYMKLNGKWLNENEELAPFNFHLGIGQIYYSYPDSITDFVQNYFNVEMLNDDIIIGNGKVTDIELIMNVDNWFADPNTYDHNIWGGDIMQKQDAMEEASQNGHDVFSYKTKVK